MQIIAWVKTAVLSISCTRSHHCIIGENNRMFWLIFVLLLKKDYIIVTRYSLSNRSPPPVICTSRGTIFPSKADFWGLLVCLKGEASHFAAFLRHGLFILGILMNILGMRAGTARDVWTLFWCPVLFLFTICLCCAHGEGKWCLFLRFQNDSLF